MTEPNIRKSMTMNQHLDSLQRGEFSNELSAALRDLVGDIENAAGENGGKAKGSITITLGFKLDNGIYELAGDVKVKAPKKRRGITHAWATPDNYLTPQNPNQVEMFGEPRLVPGNSEIRHA
ncbi:hypothetical protein [Dongia sp.]|uniref:hypothetical protein n=1 Tax=Dongia sp. TaxID=1977262 RepID=UPI0035ADE38D